MTKYVVFIGRTEYSKRIFADLKLDKEVLLEKEINNQLLYNLNRFHTSCKSNYWFRIPFQQLWYKGYLDYNALDKNAKIIFLLCEENRLCYDPLYIKFLKQTYINSKIVFYAVNSTKTMEKKYINFVIKNYDYAVTFDRSDSEKFGWIYYSGVYSRLDMKDKEIKYDVFFAGNNAGRLEKIHQMYKYLTRKGVKCLFYVNDVREHEMLENSNIIYNKKLTYDEILDFDRESKCILEITREYQKGTTLRMAEAILLGKKLITNNANVLKERYYDELYTHVFENVEDISVDFCITSAEINDERADLLAPRKMLNFLYYTIFDH